MALGSHLAAKFDLALGGVGHPVQRNKSLWDQDVDYSVSLHVCLIDSPLNMASDQSASWWKV